MRTLLPAFLTAALAAAPSASAHFVFVVPDAAAGKVRVVFSEDTQPDENVPVSKIAGIKLRLVTADKAAPLSHIEAGAALVADLPKTDGAASVAGAVEYGPFQRGDKPAALLWYHARALTSAKPADWKALASAEQPRLTIHPSAHDGKVRLTVRFDGKPVADAEVKVMGPDGKPAGSGKTDAEGGFAFAPAADGLFAVRAPVTENKAGKLDGKDYASVRHWATLTLPVVRAELSKPAGHAHAHDDAHDKGDPRAAALMARAHETRYVWGTDITGAAGKFRWTLDGRSGEGAFTADFKKRRGGVQVTVESADSDAKQKVEQHVRSLIMHRAPQPARPETAFVIVVEDEERGPLIMPLGDAMHSTYRVKDGKLVQVNRTAHGSRFTIDVQAFEQLAEGRFHTTAYTVTMWDPDTGKRVGRNTFATEGFHNVGGVYFPKREKVAFERDGKTSTLELDYSDIRFETAAPSGK